MRFCVLASGSKGNATYIEAGATRLLIDAGLSGVELGRRLAAIGVEAASLSAILVTHEHTDHIRSVAVLSRRFELPVYANRATFLAGGKALNRLHSGLEFATGTTFTVGDLAIHPFAVSHDAADPVGFVVSDGLRSVGYCTDTGIATRLIRHRLTGCHGLILESNHDPLLLKTGPYPPMLKQRVKSATGHLANADAAHLLAALLHDRLEHVVLAHISETNNRPDLVADSVTGMLAAAGDSGFAGRYSLGCQDRPGTLVELGSG